MSNIIKNIGNGVKVIWEHREEVIETGKKIIDIIKDISDDGKRNHSKGKKKDKE